MVLPAAAAPSRHGSRKAEGRFSKGSPVTIGVGVGLSQETKSSAQILTQIFIANALPRRWIQPTLSST